MTKFLPYADIAGRVAFILMPAGSKVLDFDELKEEIEKTTGKEVHANTLVEVLNENEYGCVQKEL